MSTVMIVDDADLPRQMMTRILQREGYSTVGANCAVEALRLLESGSLPDLILLDVQMPEIDGLQLLEILHDHPVWKALPVVMLSGVADTHCIRRSEQLGAKQYVVKATFSVSQMLGQIKSCIRAA